MLLAAKSLGNPRGPPHQQKPATMSRLLKAHPEDTVFIAQMLLNYLTKSKEWVDTFGGVGLIQKCVE